MLLALLQNLGMGGGVAEAVVQAGGGGDDVRAPKKRKRGDRDHRFVHDPIWASLALEREVLGAARREEYEDAVEAAEIIADSIERPTGGLVVPPPPPAPVAKAILKLPPFPDWQAVLLAIKESHRRERDRETRQKIMAYRVQVERAHYQANRRRIDDELVAEMLLTGVL